jgi:hypothetical protein
MQRGEPDLRLSPVFYLEQRAKGGDEIDFKL